MAESLELQLTILRSELESLDKRLVPTRRISFKPRQGVEHFLDVDFLPSPGDPVRLPGDPMQYKVASIEWAPIDNKFSTHLVPTVVLRRGDGYM